MGRAEQDQVQDLLRFGAEMAKKGNWREARFRWEQARALEPDNARILNNLAVAHEALGDAAGARSLYQKARTFSQGDPHVAGNAARFEHSAAPAVGQDATRADPATDPRPRGDRERRGGKVLKLPVKLPVPPRLDLTGARKVLVASFQTNDNSLVDINREIVRFLRGEFRKHSSLDVVDVTPPPPIPEQPLEDLVANAEFWRHLGREHGADLIVSGAVHYDRRDSSGFQDVDVISPVTGQKVRQTRFVEQEQFTYVVEVLFLDGATGGLRFRDRLRRNAVYGGDANDPITAFYELSDGIASDVLAVVSTRTREEIRDIFQK